MLTKRIIPCLDVRDGQVVKGTNFVNLQYAGDPVALAKKYNDDSADELVFLDITASVEKRRMIVGLVERVAREVFIPFTVGGGISTVEQVQEILAAGADKVSLNTAAVKNPQLVSEAAERFGSQAVVLAVDAKKRYGTEGKAMGESAGKAAGKASGDGTGRVAGWEVFVNGGRTPTGIDAVEWVRRAEKLGAGEVLLTSMDRDGTKEGYDLELTCAVSNAVNIPVIASGGAGKLSDFADVFEKGNADAALVASLVHYGNLTVGEIKDYLAARKVSVRT
ncbi:MAG: imidazole glycerol phosphate synthase subunit HisF [Candidatus Micrarchaeia archaeon]|jgi:cyclase